MDFLTLHPKGEPPTLSLSISRERTDENALAVACRRTGLEFMDGVANDWSIGSLLAWLVGSYRAVAKPVRPSTRSPRTVPSEREPLAAVMTQTRARVLFTLERHAFMHGRSAFIRDLADKGALTLELVSRRPVWVPANRAHLALRDRVLSLFAADALLRPADYERPSCPRCGLLSFGACCGREEREPGIHLAPPMPVLDAANDGRRR